MNNDNALNSSSSIESEVSARDAQHSARTEDPNRASEHDLTTVTGRRRWIADLVRPHVPAAIAMLKELATTARSPSARRSAARDLNRSLALLEKAGVKL
jgi:hypothetical protein